MTSRLFATLLLLGALVRVAALPLGGTHDTVPWRIWSYNAATEGVGRLYGVGGNPPEWRTLSYLGAEGQATYPPLAMYELGLAGRAYRALNNGAFPNTWPLMVAIKMPALLADIGTAILIYVVVRRVDARAARWSTLAYWLNPGIVLDGAALGYLDPQFMLPILASLVAASSGRAALAGALAAAAVLTKPQPVIMGPAIALALWHSSGELSQRVVRYGVALVAGVVCAAVICAPVFLAGGGPNLLMAMGRLEAHDMLSGNAANIWWIVGWIVRAFYSIEDYGVWGAFTHETRILAISRFIEVGGPNPRTIATLLVVAAMGWAVWTSRRGRDLWLWAGLCAFLLHAYSVLAVQVHENHLFAAVPLLVLAAAGRSGFRPVFYVVSAIFALNLNLFYGISEDAGWAIPRNLTIVDTTVLLAAVNCVALVWHGRVLAREAARIPNLQS
ncbi:MAG: hypothetical protein U0Q11_11890 [Vicinamibacterales bacterium]